MAKMRITHRKDGTASIEMEGFSGPRCREFSKPFEDKLGVAPEASEPTDDMYRADETQSDEASR